MADPCRVYWGSHGCHLPRGHEGHHVCDCCEHATLAEHIACEGVAFSGADESGPGGSYLCVATWPYYGPETRFYGEDAPVAVEVVHQRGLHHAVCSVHGSLAISWSNQLGAALDALGHLAHHHQERPRG